MKERTKTGESKGSSLSRRAFLQRTVGGAAALALSPDLLAQTPKTASPGIPTRPLGNTGVQVSILCLGGWHIGAVRDEREALRIMHAAIDEGVTFFDNAWDYHNGGSEEVMGKALAEGGKRDKVFLMTKNCERDYDGSMRNLEDSLRRLQTDYLDLWQFHEIIYDNDPEWVFEKGGIKAAMEAQQSGKVRFIGFTGHKDPRIHLKMLSQPFAWDAAQMPINVLDAHYRSFQNEVVPVCREKGVGVVGMKSMGGGIIPGRTGLTPETCIRYALSQPVSTLVVGMRSMDELKQNAAIARTFTPMPDDEQQALRTQVKAVAGDGRYELFKSTKAFDGPHHRIQHGFSTG